MLWDHALKNLEGSVEEMQRLTRELTEVEAVWPVTSKEEKIKLLLLRSVSVLLAQAATHRTEIDQLVSSSLGHAEQSARRA